MVELVETGTSNSQTGLDKLDQRHSQPAGVSADFSVEMNGVDPSGTT